MKEVKSDVFIPAQYEAEKKLSSAGLTTEKPKDEHDSHGASNKEGESGADRKAAPGPGPLPEAEAEARKAAEELFPGAA